MEAEVQNSLDILAGTRRDARNGCLVLRHPMSCRALLGGRVRYSALRADPHGMARDQVSPGNNVVKAGNMPTHVTTSVGLYPAGHTI